MTTNNNKVQSHEHYITTTQRLTLRSLQATYWGFYACSLFNAYKGQFDFATLVLLWGYIVEKFYSKYEDRVETLAFNAEWEAEREAEVAAKNFAEEFKQAVDKSKKKPTYSESIEKLFESNKDWLKDIDTPTAQDSIEDKKPTVKKKKKNG
jgi:hypothetical protein